MKIDMRDLYVLLECAKASMKIQNDNMTGFSYEVIKEVVERMINQMREIKFEIKDEEK